MHRNEFEAQLVAKAWKDPAFAAALKKDPKATVQAELAKLKGGEVKLPDNLEVQVLEESPTKMYLVIPNNPTAHAADLSEEQLMTVAGGAGVVNVGTQISGPTLDVVQVTQVAVVVNMNQPGPVVISSTPMQVIC